ncbi:MAG: hypothetical protein KatS3mg084_0286 [Candidatus Dojkabacteria bacterium]|nr:MAG: hypothetical protein KatS3mg084_0286 [Candidatus Dojkabacteria bacterium]
MSNIVNNISQKKLITIVVLFLSVSLLAGVIFYNVMNDDMKSDVSKIEEPDQLNQPSDGSSACVVAGCSGELCVKAGEDVSSMCIWKEEFACYKQPFAKCELQSDGKCGWTPNEELTQCINNSSTSIE